MRRYSAFDSMIGYVDNFMQTVFPPASRTSLRPKPSATKQSPSLNESEKKHAASLIRVNHTGEVCAQALYQGQALTARLEDIKEKMQHAALEEVDHLAWCEQRLHSLDNRVSYLNPIWYSLSFSLGAVAGLLGDAYSLGFVMETEKQVTEHLERHLDLLPANDHESREILAQMKEDEMQHATNALNAGAKELPPFIKKSMRAMSKVMTKLTYHI